VECRAPGRSVLVLRGSGVRYGVATVDLLLLSVRWNIIMITRAASGAEILTVGSGACTKTRVGILHVSQSQPQSS
jgi:hypothetical protein